MTITNSVNFTKKDAFNAMSAKSLNTLSTADYSDGIVVRGVAIGSDIDSKGDTRETTYLVAEDGQIYSGVSATARQSAELLIDMMVDEPDASYRIRGVMHQSKAGKDYLTLEMVD